MQPPARRRLAIRAVRALALTLGLLGLGLSGALAYCLVMPGASYAGAPPPLSPEQRALADELRVHVQKLSVDIGERRAVAGDSLRLAEQYISGWLSTSVPQAEVRREALVEVDAEAANIVADLRGAKKGPLILLGAHYDTAPGGTRGANDNASGTAAALALAQRLARSERRLPIRIVFFANEEPPYYHSAAMGSYQHAAGCRRRGEELRAMFSLETIGYFSDAPGSQHYPPPLDLFYPDRGSFIGFVGDLRSRSLVRDSLRAFRAHATIPSEGAALPDTLPGIAWSDHWSFWQFDYPAVMLTDTAIFRDPNYHEPSDVAENLDFEKLARVVSGVLAMVESLELKP